MNRNVWAASSATVLVIIVVILGFRASGGRGAQRLIRSDLRTVQTLANLAEKISDHWAASNKILPADLQGFSDTLTEDPTTHKKFSYRRKSDSQYELCATFVADSPKVQPSNSDDAGTFWSHSKGDRCFQFDAAQLPPPVPSFYIF